MKIKTKRFRAIVCTLLCCIIAVSTIACSNEEPEQVTIADFIVNETTQQGATGTTHTVPSVEATLSNGDKLVAVVAVKSPSNQAVSLANGQFVLTEIGNYTITYTIEINGESLSKGYTVESFNAQSPVITSRLSADTIGGINTEFDIGSIVATDYNGNSLTPTVSVKYNDNLVTPQNNVVVFDQYGTYEFNVSATDGLGNKTEETYAVYINNTISFEDDNIIGKPAVNAVISDKYARTGTKSLECTPFTESRYKGQIFSDLGIIEGCERISFWMYIDGFEGAGMLLNPPYLFRVNSYDSFGRPTARVNADDLRWKFVANRWYRFVIDLWPFNPCDGVDTIENLGEFTVDFTAYNFDLNRDKYTREEFKLYIDDITLIPYDYEQKDVMRNAPNDDEWDAPYVSSYYKGIEIDTLTYEEMRAGVMSNNYTWDNTSNQYVDFTFMHGSVENKVQFTSETDFVYESGKARAGETSISITRDDGFIYAIRAKERITFKVVPQAKMTGWLFAYDICGYIKGLDGITTKIYAHYTEDGNSDFQTAFSSPLITLEVGETFYYEYQVEFSRNVSYPPSIVIYSAIGEDVTVTEFNVPSEDKSATQNQVIHLPVTNAKASDGNTYPSTVTVLSPSGTIVKVENNSFTAKELGEYTVKYSLSFAGFYSKEFKVNCVASAPRGEGFEISSEGTLFYNSWTALSNQFKTTYSFVSSNELEDVAEYMFFIGSVVEPVSITAENVSTVFNTYQLFNLEIGGRNNAFVYAVKAKENIFVKMYGPSGEAGQWIAGVGGPRDVSAYVLSGSVLSEVYRETVSSTISTQDEHPEREKYYPEAFFVAAGETFYFQIWGGSPYGTMSFPPIIQIFNAVSVA